MKNFVLAILIAVLITYTFGLVASEWFDFSISLDNHMYGPMESIVGISVIGALMAIVGVIVAVSIFGAVLIAIVAVVVGLLIAGLSVFWPMLLVIGVIVWLVRDKRRPEY